MAASSEVTAADIARIAGVGRAAVSNWRRRHADFPQPIGGPATSPTFSLDEVQEWLQANGRVGTVNTQPTGSQSELSDSRLPVSIVALLPKLPSGVMIELDGDRGPVLEAAAVRFGAKVRYVNRDVDDPAVLDALSDLRLSADVVVSLSMPRTVDPSLSDHMWEFGPPSQLDGALASLQLAYECVKPGGTVVVLMPFSAAVRASGRRIRAELLRSGALRRVIALPTGISRAVSVPLQLWVLERPASRPLYAVEMVDVSDARPTDLPLNPDAWTTLFSDAERCRSIAAIELLDDDVLLLPGSHLEPPRRDFAAELRAQGRRYRRALADLADDLPKLDAAREPLSLPMATVADLVRLDALEFVGRQGDLEPGDVVVSGGGSRFDAIVAEDAAVPGDLGSPGTEVIRCDQGQLDPYFVACFLRSEANRRQAVGTLGGTFRLDVRRARIPRIPLDEQRAYADAYQRVMDFSDRVEALATAADDVARATIDGLTAGALLPDSTARRDR
jgi:N-6 DNA Methylase